MPRVSKRGRKRHFDVARKHQAAQLSLEASEDRTVRLQDKREYQATQLSMETSEDCGVRLHDKRERPVSLEAF
ncbi:hypothetical protein LOD99_6218 [Oopsacas minuta]|uniref:Uncharacterized protein n=1 Tax=Oopsacas minuta TaxID=111878 RepID=A0AAV7JMT9_9METZ|nr:hypothetical protein LOD99_6218 [Oopsacas minuta]